MKRAVLAVAFALLAVTPAASELYVWVDADGATHVTDDRASVPESVTSVPGAGAGSLWEGSVAGPRPVADAAARSASQRRRDRIVDGAIEDLRRGETARAAAAFESALADDPRNPTAHWYLADLDRQRGRLDGAAAHLDAFLAHAGDAYEPWRAAALRRRRALADEERLAGGAGPLRLVAVDSPHFRVSYDERLGAMSSDYARTVVGYLEDAYATVTRRIGVAPRERTGVVLYAKAAYLAAHRHRFSFPTVGFFDGRIHVASAAHPEDELRSLLVHELTHALFTERTGGDRPFWLNEGLAELAERRGRGEAALSRGERGALHRSAVNGDWIPLARLAPGFGGLDEAEARTAYLEATAAAAWIETRLDPAGVGALLDALGTGRPLDRALVAALGVDTAGLERALQRSIAAEFPASKEAD